MASLEVLSPDGQDFVELDGDKLTIGRSDTMDLVVKEDSSVVARARGAGAPRHQLVHRRPLQHQRGAGQRITIEWPARAAPQRRGHSRTHEARVPGSHPPSRPVDRAEAAVSAAHREGARGAGRALPTTLLEDRRCVPGSVRRQGDLRAHVRRPGRGAGAPRPALRQVPASSRKTASTAGTSWRTRRSSAAASDTRTTSPTVSTTSRLEHERE